MVVQHNLTAMNANRYLGINNSKLGKSLEKLSSGYAINRAGDNAAGLAVSEKMRSQIAGMTQGVKNAQDGISMVQTFEGALTETHSILQRMKTLADQMGNDSYDDPVDRTAAQQEFLQLNDELNQIADTDFNGVVVLNGGVMSDGLEQVDGKFDYANKAGQVAEKQAAALAEAQKAAQEKIDNAQSAYDSALDAYKATSNRDLCLDGNALKWNTVDNSQYTQGAADKLFDTVENADGDTMTDLKVDKINVTYKYIDTNDTDYMNSLEAGDFKTAVQTAGGAGWFVSGGTYVDANGETQEIAFDKITAIIDKIETTDNGGFIAGNTTQPTSGSSANAMYGNAVLESKDVQSGDTVTLTYTHNASDTYAPTNIGVDKDSIVNSVDEITVPKLTLDSNITDSNMTQETADALAKLDKADITFNYSESEITASISDKDLSIAHNNGSPNEFVISYTDAKGNKVNLATVSTSKAHGASDAEAVQSGGTLKTSPTVATGKYGDGAAHELTLVYDGTQWCKEGQEGTAWTATTGDNFEEAIAAVNNFLDTPATNKPMYGDKITFKTSGVAAASTYDNTNLTATYTKTKTSYVTLAGAADSDATLDLSYYDGIGWSANGQTEWGDDATNDKIAGQAFDPADAIEAGGTPKHGDKITVTVKDGKTNASIAYKASNATVGSIKFGVAIDEGKYDANGEKPTILPGKTPGGVDSTSVDKAYADTKAALAEAKAAYPKTIDDLPEEYKVSKSDAFDNSEAIMTYKDQMILQVGARTKDAVNFTFQYDSEAIGDLKADLNCTAKGLGTDKLSISTQEAANYAVDKIDQAINKVSLVRGTFGAIQNRLEHKIDNMNVSIENLTSAESSIRDTNMPQEMMNFTKQQILAQASQSMLAQANQLPQGVLSLLQ